MQISSIIFVGRLVFILVSVFILFAICISTTDSVRHSIMANLYLISSIDTSISIHIGSSIGND